MSFSAFDTCLVLLVSGSLWFCLVGLIPRSRFRLNRCIAPPSVKLRPFGTKWAEDYFGPKWAPDYTQLPTWRNSHKIVKTFAQKCFWWRWDFQFGTIKLIPVLYSTLKNKIYFRCGNEFPSKRFQDEICTCESDKLVDSKNYNFKRIKSYVFVEEEEKIVKLKKIGHWVKGRRQEPFKTFLKNHLF